MKYEDVSKSINEQMDLMYCEEAIGFGERLYKTRSSQLLSLRGLAKEMGDIVSYSAIYKYGKGKMLPSDDVLNQLRKTLNFIPGFLLKTAKDKHIYPCKIS